jgi:hemerythrin-like domain-containing protein
MANAITLLKDDHRRVKRLFRRYEHLGDRARVSKRKVVEEIIRELVVHSFIEETIFYPAARDRVPPTKDEVLESLEEHHILEWTMDELSKMKPSEERYDAKVQVMMELARHHMKEEEEELFPRAARGLTRGELRDLGEELDQARSLAPHHPHPRLPDTPVAEVLAGAVAVPLERVQDQLGKTAQGIGARLDPGKI